MATIDNMTLDAVIEAEIGGSPICESVKQIASVLFEADCCTNDECKKTEAVDAEEVFNEDAYDGSTTKKAAPTVEKSEDDLFDDAK
jgi:hypothetical protein